MIIKYTKSLCSKCYREVLATVQISDKVYIVKDCPVHGEESGILEVDPSFYLESRPDSTIYGGHLVDVTTRCNLNCKYCYYEKGNEDFALNAILSECRMNMGPFILTGGEPTLREDLPEIIRRCSEIGPTMFLTNGAGLLDKNYLSECLKYVLADNGYRGIGLSCHPEMKGFDAVVDNIKSVDIKIETVFFVVEEIDQIDKAIEFARVNKGLAGTVRVKAASNVWNEDKAGKIYNSQIIKAFEKRGPVIVASNMKSVYTPFLFEGQAFAAVSWHDITNVDLLDINCPPTYRAKTGEVCDFVKAMLINEGLKKGYMNGSLCGSK